MNDKNPPVEDYQEEVESNVEWEYYDDTTTLTDLWQKLKDECLEEDPLEFWLKTPLVDLKEAIHDYWRLKVPLILAPSYGYTSADQPLVQEHFRNALIHPLEAFICGSGNTREVFESLSKNDSQSSICGKPLQAGLAIYGCRDCGQDETCVMCPECFNVSEHRNHNYKISTTEGNGFCDCGDPEAFTNFYMCKTHEELSKKEVSPEEVLASFPPDILVRSRELIKIVIEYILAMTTVKGKTKKDEWKVGLKEKETWPDLRYVFDHSTHCVLLLNDNEHKYDEVENCIKKSLKYPEKKAKELTELVDKAGRAIVKVGDYKECRKIEDIIHANSSSAFTSNGPLKTTVLPTYLVAHQKFSIKLCSWLVELISKCSGFRSLCFDVLNTMDKTDEFVYKKVDENLTYIEKLLTKSGIVWKTVRKKWMELLVEVGLKNPKNKITLSELYIKHYQTIMTDFLEDDQESDATMANLSVQILTVPSVARHLIEHQNSFSVLVEFFTRIFNDEAEFKESDGSVDLTEWIEEKPNDFSRCMNNLHNVEYILSVPPDDWSTNLRKHFVGGTQKFIDIIAKLHLADPHIMQKQHHVEFESKNWAYVFHVTAKFLNIANLLKLWYKKDKVSLVPIFKHLMEKLVQTSNTNFKNVKLNSHSQLLNSTAQNYEIVDYDVSKSPCSIHVPLNQFLNMLLISFDVTRNPETILDKIEYHGNLLTIIDPVITVLTVLAQIKSGLWKRNGIYLVEGQLHYYHGHDPSNSLNKVNDMMLLQIATSIISDPGLIITTLLDRMNLLEWAQNPNDVKPNEENNEVYSIADEFLHILIGILCERFSIDVSNVTLQDEIRHRLSHLLVSGDLTHSEVIRNMHKDNISESKFEVLVEDCLHEIADLVTSKKNTNKRIYQLKANQQNQINPFFYFYNLQQRDEVDARSQDEKKDIFNKPPNETMPKLKPVFSGLTRLTKSLPCLIIMNTVLKRWQLQHAGDSNTTLLKHLHKILFLINVGVNDDFQSQKPDFVRAFESHGLYEVLAQTSPPSDLKDLYSHTIDRVSEARKHLLGKKVSEPTKKDQGISSSSTEDNDRKRRAQAAAHRKAKVLAQMNQMQKKFAKTYEKDLASMEVTESEVNKTAAETLENNESKKSQINSNSIAIGPNRSVPQNNSKMYTCILCQEDDTVDRNTLVYATFIVNSSVMSQVHPIDPDGTGQAICPGILPRTLKCGPTVTTCGHVMHSKCYQTMFDNLVKQHRQELGIRHNFDINQQEYNCPICQRLSNSVLPITKISFEMSTECQQKCHSSREMTKFSQWLAQMEGIVNSNMEIEKSKKILNLVDDIMKLTLKSKTIPPSVIMDTSKASMSLNFALNVMNKSLKVDPSDDDPRTIYLLFQAVSLSLQLSQSCGNGGKIQIFNPLLERDEEMLQSLVKLCMNAPYTAKINIPEGFKPVESIGLYVLVNCFKPGILNYQSSILDIDIINVLVILTATMPFLTGERFGKFDHHIMKYCAILYLIQIMAGLTSSDGFSDRDSDESDVQRLAQWVSECVGSSDKVRSSAGTVRRGFLHFLRCAAMFYHCVTDVPLPISGAIIGASNSADQKNYTDIEIYKILSKYLSLPESLGDLIKDQDTYGLITRLLQNEDLKSIQCHQMPPLKRKLYGLPRDYTEILNKVLTYECPHGASVSGKSKSVAMCLICGEMLCYESYCCGGEMGNSKVGGCTLHAQKCSAGAGIFLKPNKCELLILMEQNRGGRFPAPYVDRFGEHDLDLIRGNPLKLDQSDYEKYNKLWQQNDLQTFIARSGYSYRVEIQWHQM